MGNFVTPKAFLIAETAVDEVAMKRALEHLGVKDWTSDAQDDASLLTEFAGKSCYMSFDTSLNQNLTRTGSRTNHEYIQKGIVGNKHGSVLEHATVTFFMTNVSRVVTHEIIRHRAGTAFSQTSGRYVRTDQIDMYYPQIFNQMEPGVTDDLEIEFCNAINQMEESITKMAELTQINKWSFDIKKKLTSAFRRLVGNGQANHIVVTANHRAWRHMIEMRTDPHAEEEIRVVFADVSRQLRAKYPAIYADAKITEVDGIEVTTFSNSKV